MRFRLSLIVVSTLLFATSCNNKTKITDNKVDLEVTVGGVRVTTDINSKKEAEELEKQIEALTQQIEALRSQLAAKDTLLADEIKKLHEQMESLMEQNQKLTGRLLTLKQNDTALQKKYEQTQADLERERAARKALQESVQQAQEAAKAEEPDPEDTVWSTAVIKNLTCREITFRVMNDEGRWETITINPKAQLTFERKGEEIQVEIFSEPWLVGDVVTDESEAPIYYLDFDEDGNLKLR